MISAGITMMIWGCIALAIGISSAVYGVRFLRAQRKLKRDMETAAKLADLQLRMRYNRIAMLEPKEFHQYLAGMFSRCMEIVTDRDISKKDPDGGIALFTLAAAELIEYLGPETMEAIDYYYGKNYIMRWSKNAYALLDKRGVIGAAIQNKTIRAEHIAKGLE